MATTSLFFDIFARDVNAKETFAGIEAAGLGVGKSLAGMLAPLGLGLAGLGIADAVGHMVKAAGDFEAANTRLATSAGESVSNLKMVGDGILQVAVDTGTATDELEKGAYYIESAGYHGTEMLTVLKAAAQGAKAEGSSVQTVGDAVTSALRDYHLSASDAADVTSKMITAVGDGKTTFELFTGSLHSVLPVAAQAHISMDDILGDLASMTVHGMSADQATQDLNHTIMKLINPTQQQTSEFALFGTTAQEVQGKLGTSGLSGALDFLHDKIVSAMPPGSDKVLLDFKNAASAADPVVQKFAGQLAAGSITTQGFIKELKAGTPEEYEQGKALLALLGTTHKLGTEQLSGQDVLQNYAQAWRLLTGDQTGAATAMMLTGENADYTHKAVNDVSKATKDAAGNVKGWSEVQDTFNNKLDRFKEVIATVGIKIGEKLLPALGNALDGFVDFYNHVAPLLPDLWDKHIRPALDNIGRLFGEIFGNNSASASGNAADGFGTAMDKVGTRADGTIGPDGTVDRAAKNFTDTLAQASDDINNFMGAMDSAGKAMDDTYAGMQAAGENTRGVMLNVWMGMAYDIASASNSVETTVFGAVASVDSTWFSLVGSIASADAQIASQVVSDFAGASTWLYDAGQNVINGFVAGVGSMIQVAQDTVASVANAIIGTAKDMLGIHSPSTVFRGIGVNLAEGLALGILDGHGAVKGAMGSLSAATMTSFDMTGATTGGALMTAAPIYVQNPFTGEYLLAKVDQRAGNAIREADRYAVRRQSR